MDKSNVRQNPVARASWWERLKRTLGFAPKPKDGFQHLTHARLTNVHELMIETVHKIVVGDTGAKISRDIVLPVMRRPKDPETRVGLVDKSLVAALADVQDYSMSQFADRWSHMASVVFPKADAENALNGLRRLARIAIDESKGLYLAYTQ